MGKRGSVIYNQFEDYIDSITGAKVTRLTNPDHVSHHMYFYHNMITRDGKKLLYCAQIDGERQLYLLDMETGEAVQLTEGAGIEDYSGMLSPDDKYLFYIQEKRFMKMNLKTGETDCYYESPQGWKGSSPGPSDDYRYMAIVETKEDTVAVKHGEGWNFFRENCLARPLCRIVYIDVENKISHVVMEEHCWLGHTQIRPHDPDTILFCHEGPYDVIDARLWLVQSDGSRLRCCRKQPEDLILTHEFWLPDGKKFAFVYRETTGKKIENIRMIEPETLEEEIFMECSPYAHFITSRDGAYMVGDSQGSDIPIHLLDHTKKEEKKEIQNDFIYIIDVKKKEERRLCYHGTSWKAIYGNPQDAHPHPFFTNDNRYVIFTSDKDGMPALYRAEV